MAAYGKQGGRVRQARWGSSKGARGRQVALQANGILEARACWPRVWQQTGLATQFWLVGEASGMARGWPPRELGFAPQEQAPQTHAFTGEKRKPRTQDSKSFPPSAPTLVPGLIAL